MTAEDTTVFLVDDDLQLLEAISRLLLSYGWQVRSYDSAELFLQELPAGGAGCLLLDICMPGMDGTLLHERLRASGSYLSVIYLTGHSSVSIGVGAMKNGAYDFLEKPVDEVVLLSALQGAVAQSVMKRTNATLRAGIQTRLARLTQREQQVMLQVISGRLNKQIAYQLGIALKTVKVHRSRMMEKMGVRSVAELVALCDDAGLRDTPSNEFVVEAASRQSDLDAARQADFSPATP